MDNGEKLRAALWLFLVVEKFEITHRQKTTLMKVARLLLMEYIATVNPSIYQQSEEIPF